MTRATFSFDGKIPVVIELFIAVDNAMAISSAKYFRSLLVIPSTPELCFGSRFFRILLMRSGVVCIKENVEFGFSPR